MIRILHVMGCSDAGGISSVVRTFYEFIDRSRFHFDIALTVPQQGQNSLALQEMGAKIFFIPMKGQDRQGYCRELEKILVEGHYDGIHVHESETCYVALRLAKKLGIPCRIAHAHITAPYEGIKSMLRRWSGCLLNYPYASRVIGCGQLAGERIFGKWNMKRSRAAVLANAVDLERFTFSEQIRQAMRRELGVEDRFVLGMVARLDYQKNIPFALELMAALREKLPQAVLLIAGNGQDEEMLREKIHALGLEDRVRLLGRRSDVNRLYQAFDLLLLPSLFEGYPVVAVEALACGLPVLLSDRITGELKAAPGACYLSLKKQQPWIDAVCSWQKDENRMQRQQAVRKLPLDIRDCTRRLEQIYEEDVAAGK